MHLCGLCVTVGCKMESGTEQDTNSSWVINTTYNNLASYTKQCQQSHSYQNELRYSVRNLGQTKEMKLGSQCVKEESVKLMIIFRPATIKDLISSQTILNYATYAMIDIQMIFKHLIGWQGKVSSHRESFYVKLK